MASKKNYDHYNMFVSPDSDNSNKGRNYDNYRMFSSSNQDNSLEARIFRRRRKRLNEEARENLIEGYRERHRTPGRTTAQADLLREDREKAAETAKLIEQSYKPSNTYLPGTEPWKAARRRENANNKVGYMDDGNMVRYEDIPSMPDFRETVRTAKNNAAEERETAGILGILGRNRADNPVEAYFNRQYSKEEFEKEFGGGFEPILGDKARDKVFEYYEKWDGRGTPGSQERKYALMTLQERNVYDYILERKGKEAADNYLNSLEGELNERGATEQYQRSEEGAGWYRVPLNILKSVTGGVENAVEGITSIPEWLWGDPVEDTPSESELLQEKMVQGAGAAEGMAYKTANAIGNMLPSIAFGGMTGSAGAASAAFAAQAGGQSYRQDIMEGRPASGAQLNAVLTAADETITNLLLGGIAQYGGGAVSRLLKNSKVAQAAKRGISNALSKNPAARRVALGAAGYGADMLSEGTQEAVQDITESIRKHFIYGDELNIAGDLTDPQTWEDFALGALTAGIMNAPGAIRNNMRLNRYGSTINPDYRDYSQGIDTSRESYTNEADYQEAVDLQKLAEEYAARQRQGGYVSNQDKAQYDIRMRQWMDRIRAQAAAEQTSQTAGMTQGKNGQPEQEARSAQNAAQAWQAEETQKVPLGNARAHQGPGEAPAPDAWTSRPGQVPGMEAVREMEEMEAEAAARMAQEPQQPQGSQQAQENQQGSWEAARPYQTEPGNMTRAQEPSQAVHQAVQGPQAGVQDFGRGQAEAYAKPYGKNGQEALMAGYDGSIDVNTYSRAFGRAYDAGYQNISMDLAQESAVMAVLTEEQALAAYKAGAQDYNMEHNIRRPVMLKGMPKAGGLGEVAETATKAQRKVAEHVGKMTGLTINIVEGNRGNVRASYGRGQITLSADSDNMLGDLSHELTHFIRDYAPSAYDAYTSTVSEAEMKATGRSWENLVEDYINDYADAGQELTRQQAIEELVSDAAEKFLNDEEFINAVVKKDRDLAQRIVDFLTDVIDAIKELIRKGSTGVAAKNLEEDLKLYEEARDTWLYGLDKASEARTEGWEPEGKGKARTEAQEEAHAEGKEGDRKALAHPEQVTEQAIEENYQAVRDMDPVTDLTGEEFPRGEKKLNEMVLDFFDSMGNKAHNPVVGDVLLDSRAVKDDMNHGVNHAKAVAFAAIPDVISKGKVLDHQRNWKGRGYDSATLGAKIKIDGEDFYELVVVKLKDKNRLYVHAVYTARMGGPLSLNQVFPAATAGGTGTSGNGPAPSGSNTAVTPAARRPAGSSTTNPGSGSLPISSIFERLLNVKGGEETRYKIGKTRIKEADSDGNVLSEKQREFFKDSVVKTGDGRLKVMYHGTPNAGFTEFRPGTYFTQDKNYADQYQNPGASALGTKKTADNPDTYKVYLNIKKPFDTRLPEVRKIWDRDYFRQWGTGTPLMESGLPDWTDGMDIQEFIEENELDYDGIIVDEGGYFDNGGNLKKRGEAYIVMSPKQAKNVDNWEPSESPDIRFKLEGNEDAAETDLETLIRENEKLKAANEKLKNQFKLTPKDAVREADIARIARSILKEYNSKYSSKKLQEQLTRLYKYIRNSEDVDMNETARVAAEIGRGVLKQSGKLDTAFAAQYRDLRDQIRNTKIELSQADRQDLDAVGGYSAFRKKYFGRIRLGEGGISVDSLYQELNSQYPELFSADYTHPADQLMAIARVLDETREQVENEYHADMDEMSILIGQKILEEYADVRSTPPTFADRKQDQVEQARKKARAEYRAKMQEYVNGIRKEYTAQIGAVRKELAKELGRIKEARTAAEEALAKAEEKGDEAAKQERLKEIRNLREEYREINRQDRSAKYLLKPDKYVDSMRKSRESLQRSKDREAIYKEVKRLQSWLLRPTDTKHIPREFRGMVAQFLSEIDYSSQYKTGKNKDEDTKRTIDWNQVKKRLDEIIKAEGVAKGEDGSMVQMDIDPDLITKIEELSQKVDDIGKLNELDAYHMKELREVVTAMGKAITEVNDVKSNERYTKVSEMAEAVLKDIQPKKNRTEYTGATGAVDKLLNYDMLDPLTMFHKLGPSAYTVWESLREGLNKKTLKLKKAEDLIGRLMKENDISGKDIREWSGKDAKTIIFKLPGGEIKLTTGQIMALYVENRRGQARKHIYSKEGGIKAGDRSVGVHLEKGRLVTVSLPHVEKGLAPIRVSEADVKAITDTLTPQQKALADGIQQFMGKEVASWGNEVSMAMYGYEKFTAREYFPIKTDENYIPVKESEGGTRRQPTIKNLGMTKSTNEHANNPIIIEDIFDVYTRQVDQMSSYNAYVLPLSDLQKVLNYKDAEAAMSMRQEINRALGSSANRYLAKLIDDINGSVNYDKGLGEKLISNMKAASVAGNIRVVIQQPTAYLRALAEIDGKYLAKGAVTLTRKDQWKLICKYAPIAQWKDWGFYRMDTSRQMKDILLGTDSKTQKFVNLTMKPAEMADKLAWNRLWRACERECMDKHPALQPETEEFYQEVGKRFSEIIDKTQVVDSVLHRTQIMRSENGLTKMATSFMGEPLKTVDILYRSTMDLRENVPGAKKRAGKAAAAVVTSALLTSLVASLPDTLRDDDREKSFGEKYLENLRENMIDNLTLINNIPWAKDILSVAQGNTPGRTDLGGFQDLYYAYQKIMKLKDGESQYTPQYVAAYTVQMTSKLTGIPIRSIVRDAGSLVDTVFNAIGGEADYHWLQQVYSISSQENLTLYVQMMVEAKRQGKSELAAKIKTDLNKAGIDNDKISSKIRSVIKKELTP